jgi:hypothetical protein
MWRRQVPEAQQLRAIERLASVHSVGLNPRCEFWLSMEELIGTPEPVKRAGKRGPTPKLQQQVERLSRLPQQYRRHCNR